MALRKPEPSLNLAKPPALPRAEPALRSIAAVARGMIGPESLAFRVARDLLDLGVFALPVPYPVVPYGQSLIRTSVMPTHTRAHLDQALDAFKKVRTRYDIPEFDPDNLPVADHEDWSWFMPDQANSTPSPVA